MLILALLTFWISEPISRQVHFTLKGIEDPSGWYVRSGTLTLPLDASGKITLAETPDTDEFVLCDQAGHVHYSARWSELGPDPVRLTIEPKRLFVKETVSLDRTRREADRLPAELTIVRPEEQPERPVMQTAGWVEEQAEILVQRTNLGGGSPIIRGMSGNRVLLMVDGFRVNNATFRLGLNQYLNTVPAGLLQQVEVLAGPTGVQYGSDGLGGTVHMRSLDPLNTEQAHLGYQGWVSSADGTHVHKVQAQQHFGRFALNGAFSRHDFANLEAGDPVGEQIATGYDAWDGSLNLSIEVGSGRLRLINFGSHSSHVPRTDRVATGRDLQWDYHPQDFQLHGLRYETPLHLNWADKLETGLAFMRQEEGTQRIGAATPQRREETYAAVDTLQWSGTVHKSLGATELVFGLDAVSDSLETSGRLVDLNTGQATPRPGKFPDDASYDTLGAFLMASRNLPGGYELRGGLRYSSIDLAGTVVAPIGHVAQTYDHLTPTLALGRQLGSLYVGLSAGQGFRAPNLEDALAIGPANRGYDVPNPGLEPEDVWNYEVNLRYFGARSTTQLTVYQADYDQLIERVRGTWQGSDMIEGEPVYFLDNVGEARVEGVSAAFDYSLGARQTLVADASWTFGTQTDLHQPMTRIPPLRGNLTWRYATDQLALSSVFAWARRQDRLSPGDIDDSRIGPEGTPGFQVLHLRGRYQFNRLLSASLALENLTDEVYKHHGSGIYNPGRRWIIGLEASWH